MCPSTYIELVTPKMKALNTDSKTPIKSGQVHVSPHKLRV